MSDQTTTAEPDPKFYLDRPSARTSAERLAHFDQWWEKHGEPYQAAVIEAGAEPWTKSVDERRELWMRRYAKR
jgi:hypothetical protein